MPTSLLQVLNDLLLVLVLLFFLRVLRAVWVQVNPPAPAPVATAGPAPRSTGAPAKKPPAALRLRIADPEPLRGQTFDLGDEMTLGRSPGCGVHLTDTAISQMHARLFRQNGSLWIEDLGSTNGTWVNRRKVAGPMPLKRGDRIGVGGTVLEVTR